MVPSGFALSSRPPWDAALRIDLPKSNPYLKYFDPHIKNVNLEIDFVAMAGYNGSRSMATR